jgi:hypothetical protein
MPPMMPNDDGIVAGAKESSVDTIHVVGMWVPLILNETSPSSSLPMTSADGDKIGDRF